MTTTSSTTGSGPGGWPLWAWAVLLLLAWAHGAGKRWKRQSRRVLAQEACFCLQLPGDAAGRTSATRREACSYREMLWGHQRWGQVCARALERLPGAGVTALLTTANASPLFLPTAACTQLTSCMSYTCSSSGVAGMKLITISLATGGGCPKSSGTYGWVREACRAARAICTVA